MLPVLRLGNDSRRPREPHESQIHCCHGTGPRYPCRVPRCPANHVALHQTRSIAQKDPTLFDSIFNTDASQLNVDVTEISGGLDARLVDLQVLTTDRHAATYDLVADDDLVTDDGPSL